MMANQPPVTQTSVCFRPGPDHRFSWSLPILWGGRPRPRATPWSLGCAAAAVLAAVLAATLLATTALAGAPRFARLGTFEGSVEVQFDAADTWRPAALNLPLTESTRIRTGPAAKVEIEFDDTSVFRMTGEGLAELSDYTRLSGGQRITVVSLDHGLAYFTGEAGAGNAIHLLVPGAQVALRQGSRLRLQASQDWSEIAIIEGATRFTIPSAEMDLHQGQSARVTVPESTHFSLFREIAPIESDRWSEGLDKVESAAPSSRLDLDRAGKWITAGDYGTVWQPAPQAGWAPFREGRWIWYQSVGFVWAGAETWGWKPYHEGRWLQHPDLGWVWVPPPTKSPTGAGAKQDDFLPGEVFWARAPNIAAWGPLAPGELWTGAGQPRQLAALNLTGGTFVAGAREIVPSPQEDLPKDLLKVFLFTSALPSPPLPVSRLVAPRDPLRTRLFSAVDVAPAVPAEMTEAVPPAQSDTTPLADVPPSPAPPVSAPPAADPDPPPDVLYPYPVYTGIIIMNPPEKVTTPLKKQPASTAPAKTTGTATPPGSSTPPTTVTRRPPPKEVTPDRPKPPKISPVVAPVPIPAPAAAKAVTPAPTVETTTKAK